MNRLLLTLLVSVTSCAPPPSADPGFVVDPAGRAPARVGVLVMAHGGSAEWNRQVVEAIDPLRDLGPAVVAFGSGSSHSG